MDIFLMDNKGLNMEGEANVIYLNDEEDPYDDRVIEFHLKQNTESANVAQDVHGGNSNAEEEVLADEIEVDETEEEVAEVIETGVNADMDEDAVI